MERATEDDLDSQVPNHTLVDMSVQQFYGRRFFLRRQISEAFVQRSVWVA